MEIGNAIFASSIALSVGLVSISAAIYALAGAMRNETATWNSWRIWERDYIDRTEDRESY